jgi:hypothetical protein
MLSLFPAGVHSSKGQLGRAKNMPTIKNNANAEAEAEEETPEVWDWRNLPKGTDEVSLWGPLHDARLVSIRSSLFD